MRFAPLPENDFAEYIRTYYRECRYWCPKIEGIAGKWMFRDLFPAMSDFDTRFILNDDMGVDDWCEMSMAIGEAHLYLCDKYSCWARNFEHLPGINLTWSELTSERNYYPEFQQWTYYHSEHPEKVSAALDQFARRSWDDKDEYFHIKKFLTFYGRYDRQIDPAVQQSLVDFLGEQALAADIGQGPVEHLVPGGLDDFDGQHAISRQDRIGDAKAVPHLMGLDQGQGAAACANTKGG